MKGREEGERRGTKTVPQITMAGMPCQKKKKKKKKKKIKQT